MQIQLPRGGVDVRSQREVDDERLAEVLLVEQSSELAPRAGLEVGRRAAGGQPGREVDVLEVDDGTGRLRGATT